MEILKFKAFDVFAVLLFILIMSFTIYYFGDIYSFFKDPNSVQNLTEKFGSFSFVVFIGMQIFQVLIFIIPGEIVQIAGGYLFGTVFGVLLSITGITIGSIIAFKLSRLIGKKSLERLIGEDKLEKINNKINMRSGNITIFLLFLIPGTPKDLLSYVVGLTSMKFNEFFFITIIARFPAIFMSSYFGAHLAEKNYTLIVIIAVICIALSVLGMFNEERIINRVNKIFRKTSE